MVSRMQRGSGNVFPDLGFPPEGTAAKALGVTQPRIIDLVRGRIDHFSIEPLVEMLTRFYMTVTVKTRRRRRVA